MTALLHATALPGLTEGELHKCLHFPQSHMLTYLSPAEVSAIVEVLTCTCVTEGAYE
jgi:hypothetical protein